MGALDLAVDACADFVAATGMPFISGKDSLSSTYRGQDGDLIKIPPILCISAFGRIPDVSRTVSADFKKPGSKLLLVGYRKPEEMAGSVYYELLGYTGNNLPQLSPESLMKVFQAVHRAINAGQVLACHDLSEGGLGAAVAEMGFGSGYGADLVLPDMIQPELFLFNETAGNFLLEVPADADHTTLFTDVPCQVIGHTTENSTITLYRAETALFRVELEKLKAAWQKPMKEVFGQ
jgi:phosphoribosylformylglycinamidine synthase